MALPFLVESTPRAYGLKAGNADLSISTDYGTFPHRRAERVIPQKLDAVFLRRLRGSDLS